LVASPLGLPDQKPPDGARHEGDGEEDAQHNLSRLVHVGRVFLNDKSLPLALAAHHFEPSRADAAASLAIPVERAEAGAEIAFVKAEDLGVLLAGDEVDVLEGCYSFPRSQQVEREVLVSSNGHGVDVDLEERTTAIHSNVESAVELVNRQRLGVAVVSRKCEDSSCGKVEYVHESNCARANSGRSNTKN